jgi:Domain of unknown function (DUF1883)
MSQFLHRPLGYLPAGTVVEVSLQTRAVVRLLDETNFQTYRNGGSYRFFGGEALRKRVPLEVPNAGTWHAVIDLNGASGTVRGASVTVRKPN